MRRIVAASLLALLAAGCGLFGGDEKKPLPGERISVMLFDRKLEADPRLADLAVTLPPPEANEDWAQPGGAADHSMHHLAIAEKPSQVWSVSIGDGTSRERRLLASPVVAAGKVFAMDTSSRVSAYDALSGRQVWRRTVVPSEFEDDAFGGGVAYEDGRLFVTTGAAEVLALDAATGAIAWRVALTAPFRSGPAVANGRVFAVSVDNQIHALDMRDGAKLWNYAGIAEIASLLGGASPAVDQGMVVAPFSSGEIAALRVESGRMVWSDTLVSVRRVDAVSSLADIRALPVMDRGRVYAVSHSGRMAAIDLRSGARVWDISLAAIETPWIAGDFLFVVTVQNELASLSRRDGRVRWVRQLPMWRDEKKQKDRIYWVGPVLASDRLVVGGSDGSLLSISPYDGALLSELKVSAGVRVAPVVAGRTLYVITDDADLVAFR